MTVEGLRIRKAQLTDADALASCIDAAYAQYAERISDMPPVSEGCAEEIAENLVWVAVEGNEIIGGLFLVSRDGFMKLANLAVHPDHSGKGLGGKLIALSEKAAKKRGYSEMRLNTHVAMPENVQFYSHLGWEELSREGNTVSMRKIL
ncbi:MAG: GNAT family N-acetyltransferase [Alphaproteobacteria bacterium]|nr:GNAT family N-acetyltransferase [Alphaproteobacteria bacterium]